MLEILQNNWLFLLVGEYPAGPLGGLAMTLILALSCLALSLPLGIILAVAAVSPSNAARRSAVAIIVFFRGMPLMLLIFWAYYLLPSLTGLMFPAAVTLLTALVLYQSAYMAEVVRAGIRGVPSGQSEAGAALGFGFLQQMTYFILPQALKAMLPSLTSQFISIMKETSLGYVISVSELNYVASQINNTLLTRSFEVYAILAIIYFMLCYGLASLARLGEWHFARRNSQPAAKLQFRPE